ncbi:hypothetical protein Salat_2927000 [Sesamum alatum]|uniref:Uncharacterized protein n=1 Tax=Sesamum alatum TaxID=300844 RepID=A0AAE1XJX5_9LAMI|nr:hypothetical protein Salat_2927000 [Sesamum alatum]
MSSQKRSRGEGFSSRSARSIPCSRSSRGPSIVPPSIESLGGNLTFQSRIAKDKFCLATQLQSTLNKNRTLILGSYITVLATNLGVLDPDNHNLRIACVSEPLDMACLIRWTVSFDAVSPLSLPLQVLRFHRMSSPLDA